MRNNCVGRFLQQGLVLILLQAGLCLLTIPVVFGQEVINDHMFAPHPAAKAYSDFDSKGFLINGKRTFLVSAGMEYARVPHELWADRLLRLKRGGFNCVEIYTIWNFHEPREGQFEFSGDQDLDLFLSMVKEMGMYAIVRVGPYYCAEWDQGGYPIWLRFKKGLKVREENAEFERYVDRFFDRLIPIVAKHQINKGGSVILVQLENEHPKGWGTLMPDHYFKHLQSKTLSLGLEVPYLFSGVHHSTDPAGNAELDDSTRPNPWFSTEFWSTWYTQYGAKPGDAALYDRRTWKIIAHGGNGYNFYMAYGGSNFGYTNNDEDAASYDYGAAVGQAGDLRPLYYTFKRAGIFSRSFETILENSQSATKQYQYINRDTALKVTARTSPAGDLIFLDNPGAKVLKTAVHINKQIPDIVFTLAPGEIYPVVHRFSLSPAITLDWALTRIYGVVKQNHTTTLLVQANAGEAVYLQFSTAVKPVVSSKTAAVKTVGNQVLIHNIAGLQPAEYLFKSGTETVRVLVMNKAGMDRTWLTETDASNAIITGVSYLDKVEMIKGRIFAQAEYPLGKTKDAAARIYTEKGSKALHAHFDAIPVKQPLVRLRAWEHKNAAVTASFESTDKNWLSSKDPLQMGADGDVTADAWYLTKIEVPSPGKYSLQVNGGDRGTAFVDGQLLTNWKIRDGEVALDLKEGKHDLAIFTAHNGRDKMAAYLGPIEDIDKKGLSGRVILKKGGPFIRELDRWFFMKAKDSAAVKAGPPALDTLVAEKYKIGADAFALKEGFGWFQTVIPAQPGLSELIISFKSVDENATVFVNGKKLTRHEGWNIPFELKVSDQEELQRPLLLSVFIENHSKEGGIDQPVKINTIGEGTLLTGWKMHGGTDIPGLEAVWEKYAGKGSFSGPRFFRASFVIPDGGSQHLIWRVNPDQLSHGSVWVNGHNLGRYPEINGHIGLYIPEPWLKKGVNSLVIYDEEGKNPDQVNISSEKAAGRVKYTLSGLY